MQCVGTSIRGRGRSSLPREIRKGKKNWRLRKGGGTDDPQRVCAYVSLFRVAARGICRGTAEVSSGMARGGQGETDPKPKQHGSEHRQFQFVERKEGKKKNETEKMSLVQSCQGKKGCLPRRTL